MSLWKVVPLLCVVAACSSRTARTDVTLTPSPVSAPTAAAKPAGIDPVGTYEFSTVVQGEAVTGRIDITGTPGAYTGRIVTGTFPEIPVISANVASDNILDVKASMPDGELVIHMVFTGSEFKGNWSVMNDSGDIHGRKLVK